MSTQVFGIITAIILRVTLGIAAASGERENPVPIFPGITIAPYNPDLVRSNLGLVNGARQCGGNGHFLEWRIAGCRPTDIPCQVPADDSLRQNEVYFVPSRSIPEMGLRLGLVYPGKEPWIIFDQAIPHSAVTVGTIHILRVAGQSGRELQGKTLTGRQVLYDLRNVESEICVEAEFTFV